MTRGAQRERERLRAESKNAKHKPKGAEGDPNMRKERDAEIMRTKQQQAQQRNQPPPQ